MVEGGSGSVDEDRAQRALLDRIEDLRYARRTLRLRRAARAVVLLVIAAGIGVGFAIGTDQVLRGEGNSFWTVVAGAAFALVSACLGYSMTSTVALLATRRAEIVAVQREHRDEELDEWETTGWSPSMRVQGRTLDELDDTRRERRLDVWHLAVTGGLTVASAALLTAGLLLAGPEWTWPGPLRFGLVALSGVLVATATMAVSAVLARRLGPTRANLVWARRRHREVSLYDVDPEGRSAAVRVEVPPLRAHAGVAFWLTVAYAVVALVLVREPPGDDPASLAAGRSGADAPPPPTVLAGRQLSVPLNYPAGIVLTPDGRRAYVANSGSTDKPDVTVSTVDLTTNTTVAAVTVAPGPQRVALSPDGTRLAVLSIGSAAEPRSTLSLVDTASMTVARTVTLPATGNDVVYSGSSLWVSLSDQNDAAREGAAVLDPGTGRIEDVVRVGRAPFRMAVTPDGRRLYLTNYSDNTLSVIDTASRRVVATAPTGGGPISVVADPVRHAIWVTNQSEPDPRRALMVFDDATLRPTAVDLGPAPPGTLGLTSAALTPDGRRLLVGRYSSDSQLHTSLTVVDPATRATVGTVDMGYPYQIAPTPDAHHAYTTSGVLWSVDVP